MQVVVDANIIFSALIGGRLTDLFLSSKLDLVAPELIFVEFLRNKEELIRRSKLSEEDFNILLTLLERRIKVIPFEEFEDLFSKAEELLGDHIKDAPYVALALKLKCPFWTYEKRFKKIREVKCLTTEDIAKIVNELDN